MKLDGRMFTEVTVFSKWLALAMLVVLPVAGFFLGRWYQYVTDTVAVIRITDRKDGQLQRMASILGECRAGMIATPSGTAK